MSVETHIHRARDRVESERETVSQKYHALEDFADRVAEIETAGEQAKQVGGTVTGPVSTVGGGGGVDRQELLAATTSTAGRVGVSHRSLVQSLYEDFPVTYPALSTVARLLETCEHAQETVRAHLVRRA